MLFSRGPAGCGCGAGQAGGGAFVDPGMPVAGLLEDESALNDRFRRQILSLLEFSIHENS